MKRLIFLGISLFFMIPTKAQTVIDSIQFSYLGNHEFLFTWYALSARINDNHPDYLYTAGNEAGFVTFDISNPATPVPVDTLRRFQDFDSLGPTNFYQYGDTLLVSLGGFFSNGQRSGLALVDVSSPANPTLISQWDSTGFLTGAAIAKKEGNYAYLGAMETGFIILDISNPANIQFVSVTQPAQNWPPGIPYAPNVRGMEIKNDTLYLAYDAGGLRIYDVSNKSAPVEIARHYNTSMDSVALLAYNNVLLIGTTLYICVDYCGLEVVDVSDAANPATLNWLNPWNCMGTSWQGSPGHSNELFSTRGDSILFISGADVEIQAYDITDRANPRLLGEEGALNDSICAWGVDIHGDLVATAIVDNSFLWNPTQPYYSDQGGFRLYNWETFLSVGNEEPASHNRFKAHPNPFEDQLLIPTIKEEQMAILGIDGSIIWAKTGEGTEIKLNTSEWPKGIYFLRRINAGNQQTQKLIRY